MVYQMARDLLLNWLTMPNNTPKQKKTKSKSLWSHQFCFQTKRFLWSGKFHQQTHAGDYYNYWRKPLTSVDNHFSIFLCQIIAIFLYIREVWANQSELQQMAMGIISIIKKSRSVSRRETKEMFCVCVFRFERFITKERELLWKYRLIPMSVNQ